MSPPDRGGQAAADHGDVSGAVDCIEEALSRFANIGRQPWQRPRCGSVAFDQSTEHFLWPHGATPANATRNSLGRHRDWRRWPPQVATRSWKPDSERT